MKEAERNGYQHCTDSPLDPLFTPLYPCNIMSFYITDLCNKPIIGQHIYLHKKQSWMMPLASLMHPNFSQVTKIKFVKTSIRDIHICKNLESNL